MVPFDERIFGLPNQGFRTLIEAFWNYSDARISVVGAHASTLLERDDYDAVLVIRNVAGSAAHLRHYAKHSIPLAVWQDDIHRYMWTNDEESRLQAQRFEMAAVILLPYFEQFVEHRTWKAHHGKAIRTPWSVPDWIFDLARPWSTRDATALLSGKVSRQYQLRSLISLYARICKDPLIRTLDHPGYDARNPGHRITGRAFYDVVASVKAAFATTAHAMRGRIDYTVAKYVEIPACGALALMEETSDLDSLGFIDGVNCVRIRPWNFREKSRFIFSADAERVASAGMNLVRSRHSHGVRVAEMAAAIDRACFERKEFSNEAREG
jgi:hypothetical protein